MTSPDGVIDVDADALRAAAEALASGAHHLHEELRKLDGEVVDMLAAWKGVAGGSYRPAWEQWHSGAAQVQAALARIADWLATVGPTFESNETASAQAIKGVHGG